MRGIFDGHILSHTPGDRFIYEVVKEYFEKNSPVSQHVEGRLNIVSSVSPVVMSPILMLVTMLLKMWN